MKMGWKRWFCVEVLLNVAMSPSLDALYEAFADLTLLFGFLQNSGNITVIGVGWFLGLIFVFYTCFPFFCVLLQNKRRAWLSFIISLFWNFACSSYFSVGRSNILYSSCYFLAGGLVYLYRKEISKINRWVVIIVATTSVVMYYTIGANTVTMLLISILLLSYTVICAGSTHKSIVLENPITHFISGISMEIYLSHMVIFRVIERLRLNRMIGDGWLQYVVTVVFVLAGTIVSAVVMQKIIEFVMLKIKVIRGQAV